MQINSISDATVTQSSSASRRLPLFQVDLVVQGEGAEAVFAYSTPEDAFLALPLKYFDRLVVGEFTAATSVNFLLLPVSPGVSCSRVDALHTHVAVNLRRLLPSPAVSHCLHPV